MEGAGGFHVVDVGAPPAPDGYTLVMPPGWERVPLRSGTDDALRKIVDDAVARAPDDVPRDKLSLVRMELLKRLRKSARDARDHSGLDLYLPVEEIHGVTVGASFVVSEFSFDSVAEVQPALVAARLLSTTDEAVPVTVDDALGVRVERVVEADARRGADFPARRVDYVLSVPEDPVRWVTVGFSTVADGDPRGELADVLVELFDAIMTTFRWRRP
jgi:hypothetical protein